MSEILTALPCFSIKSNAIDKIDVTIIGNNQELARLFYAMFSTTEPEKRKELFQVIQFAMQEADKVPASRFQNQF